MTIKYQFVNSKKIVSLNNKKIYRKINKDKIPVCEKIAALTERELFTFEFGVL